MGPRAKVKIGDSFRELSVTKSRSNGGSDGHPKIDCLDGFLLTEAQGKPPKRGF